MALSGRECHHIAHVAFRFKPWLRVARASGARNGQAVELAQRAARPQRCDCLALWHAL